MDEQPQKKRMGRPPGTSFDKATNVQLSAEDDRLLKNLAKHWRCSGAAAIRRAVKEAADREGVGGE